MTTFTNEFSKSQWISKYRFGDEDNVDETFKRVAKAVASVEVEKEIWSKEFFKLLQDFKFVPGGRILSNAGTGLAGTTLLNCFSGDTKIITRGGIKTLKSLENINIRILSRHGKWADAIVLNFGKQKLYKLTLKKNRDIKVIYTTQKHRWFANTKAISKYNELTTDELKNYHRLEQCKSKSLKSTIASVIGIAQGFTFGDGTKTPDNIPTNTYLCGEKDQVLKQYFGICPSATYNGNLVFNGLPNSWKKYPDLTENSSFLYGWLAGYFAADGSVSECGECVISSAVLENIEYVKSVCSILGIRYFKIKTQDRISNLTGTNSVIYTLCLDSKDLEKDFFIIPEHKNRFLNNQRFKVHHWHVVSTEETDRYEDVYCAVVPSSHNFTLEGNILTGNCYVDGFTGKDQDSIDGIYNAVYRQAKTLQSEGGYGFCADVMRPRGANISGIANQSPGAVAFCELWDKSSEIITSGSGKKSSKGEKSFIRKGAQMVTMSVWHPDIIEFITAKQTKGRLSKFNMSVLISDEFMRAVEDNIDWDLEYPNYKKYPEEYKKNWDGNIAKWKSLYNSEEWLENRTIVYKTIKAREIWNLITESTYNRNEPGVLFVDTMNRMNNLWYTEWINATNPCGEQILPKHGVCLLGSLNLTQFINLRERTFDWEKLRKYIHIGVRFLDNVNDITNVPLPEQKETMLKKRRIGMGIVGYASALMRLKIPYGSEAAIKRTEELMQFIANEAYQASALLAGEKGSFPEYIKEDYLKSNFIMSALSEETINIIEKYGMRNSHCLSIQPTGNSSVFANLISSGCEPIFNAGYIRTYIVDHPPNNMNLPINIDWQNKDFDIHLDKETEPIADGNLWKWTKEGDEEILITEFEGQVYKFDRNRGLTKEEWVEDYGVSWLKKDGEWNDKEKWATFAMNLNVDAHINTLSIFAKYIDSAISKTLNFPADYPYEDFKGVYTKAWKNGIKGVTTYREGTMTAVLSTKSTAVKGIQKTTAPKRPKQVECDVHHIKVKGQDYFVLVGLYEGEPYEVFAGRNGVVDKKVKKGIIVKRARGKYKALFEDDSELSPISAFTTDEEDTVTRLISANLRHGTSIDFIVHQLEKSRGDMQSFSKCIARALKKYIADGTEVKGEECPDCKGRLVRKEGCCQCIDCGFSKCA